MSKNIKILLSEKNIKESITFKEIIRIVEDGFRKKGLGLVNLPPKMGPKLNLEGAFADSMPVSILKKNGELETYGLKWLSAFKSNIKKGVPYINCLIVLNDSKTGKTKAILDGGWITAIRTAGVSAVTAKYLAPKKQRLKIGIFGLGLQAYVHVQAFKEVFKNPEFILFNHDSKSLSRFLKRFKNEKFEIENNSHSLVKKADIILSATTFTSRITPYIYEKDLKDDVLILPLDYGSRIDPKVYDSLDEAYTDDISQYIQKSKIRTYFPSNRPNIKKEVSEIVLKKIRRGKKPKRILVFNLGIALFDILTAMSVIKKSSV